jgi:hypothetical protein
VIPSFVDLAVQIVRFVDDYQPGIVECEFADSIALSHALIGKAPIFTTELLNAVAKYPLTRCRSVHGAAQLE